MATDTFDLFAPRREERPALRVSELNDRAAAMLEQRFGQVLVEGEISGFLAHRSGHWYFSLKDDRAQVQCCCFKGQQRWIHGRPKDGDHVVVRGKLTIYGARGNYQLVVEHIKANGQGALLEKLEALKQRLTAEGLFAAERKRPLPPIVRAVGLITSPDGAAVRDYMRVALQRDPGLRIVVFPTPVQGASAAPSVARAIAHAAARAQRLGLDVIVVTRGGGAIEDLWAFNDEQVVRAMADCPVPCVSAIGHEVDTTLCDFAADVRAATPTAAAQMTSADMIAVRERFTRRARDLARLARTVLDRRRVRLHQARLALDDPRRRLLRSRQRIDLGLQDMERALQSQLGRARERLRRCEAALHTHHPRRRVAAQRTRLDAARLRLERALLQLGSERKARLARLAAKLDALSPLGVLGRGYALVRTPAGRVVRRADDVAAGDAVHIRLERGELIAAIKETRHD